MSGGIQCHARGSREHLPLSIGLIGCGYAAEIHLDALRDLPHAKVVAVADIEESARRAIAQRGGGLPMFDDYRALLDQPGIDVVAILTPPYMHLEMATAAFDAGKHVMLEKPITGNLEEADQLLERAARSSAKVIVGYNLRFHPQLQEAQRCIREGGLGVRSSSARRRQQHPPIRPPVSRVPAAARPGRRRAHRARRASLRPLEIPLG